MKHARKMVLVEFEDHMKGLLVNKNKNNRDGEIDVLVTNHNTDQSSMLKSLRRQMDGVMKQKNLNIRNKNFLYTQLLRRYQHVASEIKNDDKLRLEKISLGLSKHNRRDDNVSGVLSRKNYDEIMSKLESLTENKPGAHRTQSSNESFSRYDDVIDDDIMNESLFQEAQSHLNSSTPEPPIQTPTQLHHKTLLPLPPQKSIKTRTAKTKSNVKISSLFSTSGTELMSKNNTRKGGMGGGGSGTGIINKWSFLN